jgi:repressor LexA
MEWDEQDPEPRSDAVRIPVLGRVAAGIPFDAVEEVIDYEEISSEMARDGDYFGLRIQGDSMEPKISNGDVVIVRKQEDADDGDLVIAIVNGYEGCCKRLRKYADGTIGLISTNPSYAPMFFTASEVGEKPIRIVGIVKELRAKF